MSILNYHPSSFVILDIKEWHHQVTGLKSNGIPYRRDLLELLLNGETTIESLITGMSLR